MWGISNRDRDRDGDVIRMHQFFEFRLDFFNFRFVTIRWA
jgi:hypothetical protein